MSYTWFSDRWVMPAPYYKTSMIYEAFASYVPSVGLQDLGFDVEIYFLDSNFMDAKPPEEDRKPQFLMVSDGFCMVSVCFCHPGPQPQHVQPEEQQGGCDVLSRWWPRVH